MDHLATSSSIIVSMIYHTFRGRIYVQSNNGTGLWHPLAEKSRKIRFVQIKLIHKSLFQNILKSCDYLWQSVTSYEQEVKGMEQKRGELRNGFRCNNEDVMTVSGRTLRENLDWWRQHSFMGRPSKPQRRNLGWMCV